MSNSFQDTRKWLGKALDLKEKYETLRLRIDWQKSVFLIHPNDLKKLKVYFSETHDTYALKEQGDMLYLFELRLLTDDKQAEGNVPELLVSLSSIRSGRI